MISQSAEYALRAVVCLAQSPQIALTTQQIAKLTKVPAGYLSKVLQALGRAGMVVSQRGLNGGFVLARPPEALSLLDVVRAVDLSRRIRTCPLGIHGPELCPLHHRIDKAIETAETSLAQTTISEMLVHSASTPLQPGNVRGLCSQGHHRSGNRK